MVLGTFINNINTITMTPKIKEIYIRARKNKEFLKDIKNADNDTKPSVLSSDLKKHLFANMYYGWLVAKHGQWWEMHV